jgi:hypothetical protein
LFVAVGGNGTILTSSDGAHWVAQTSGTTPSLSGIAYGNGIFVASSYSFDGVQWRGVVRVSSNAVAWNQVFLEPGVSFYKIAFGGGIFLASASNERIFISVDGLNWNQCTSGALSTFAATYGNGTFVAVGPYGTILQTERLLKVALRAGNSPELSITGPVGAHRYRIEASSNLAVPNWSECETISVTETPHVWRDTTGVNVPQRFYRAVLLPEFVLPGH